MNTSELVASVSRRPVVAESAGAFSLSGMSIAEEDLGPVREAIYHSRGPGYYLFRGFLDPAAVAHLRTFWTTIDPTPTYAPFSGKQAFHAGSPDYCLQDGEGNRTFYNFFWNAPTDELTYVASMYVQAIRNRISGRIPYAEVYPHSGKAVCYRVILSRNAKTWIAPHRDYFDYERRLEKNRYDPSRVQATLFLSAKGRDYRGTGFTLESNQGKNLVFGDDVEVRPGDLAVWRYNNLHSVQDVSTDPGQLGFLRIIYPAEDIPARPLAPIPTSRERRSLRALVRGSLARLIRGPR